MTNEIKPLIYSRICDAMNDIEGITKDQKNQQQGFKYRGIDDVYNSLHGILAKNRLFTTSKVLSSKSEERASKSGGILFYKTYELEYTIYTDDGSSISSIIIGEAMDSGDKASNKAFAIAHKYFFLQLFAIPTEEIKDPDAVTHEVKAKEPAIPDADVIADYVEEAKERFNLASTAKELRDICKEVFEEIDKSKFTISQKKLCKNILVEYGKPRIEEFEKVAN